MALEPVGVKYTAEGADQFVAKGKQAAQVMLDQASAADALFAKLNTGTISAKDFREGINATGLDFEKFQKLWSKSQGDVEAFKNSLGLTNEQLERARQVMAGTISEQNLLTTSVKAGNKAVKEAETGWQQVQNVWRTGGFTIFILTMQVWQATRAIQAIGEAAEKQVEVATEAKNATMKWGDALDSITSKLDKNKDSAKDVTQSLYDWATANDVLLRELGMLIDAEGLLLDNHTGLIVSIDDLQDRINNFTVQKMLDEIEKANEAVRKLSLWQDIISSFAGGANPIPGSPSWAIPLSVFFGLKTIDAQKQKDLAQQALAAQEHQIETGATGNYKADKTRPNKVPKPIEDAKRIIDNAKLNLRRNDVEYQQGMITEEQYLTKKQSIAGKAMVELRAQGLITIAMELFGNEVYALQYTWRSIHQTKQYPSIDGTVMGEMGYIAPSTQMIISEEATRQALGGGYEGMSGGAGVQSIIDDTPGRASGDLLYRRLLPALIQASPRGPNAMAQVANEVISGHIANRITRGLFRKGTFGSDLGKRGWGEPSFTQNILGELGGALFGIGFQALIDSISKKKKTDPSEIQRVEITNWAEGAEVLANALPGSAILGGRAGSGAEANLQALVEAGAF